MHGVVEVDDEFAVVGGAEVCTLGPVERVTSRTKRIGAVGRITERQEPAAAVGVGPVDGKRVDGACDCELDIANGTEVPDLGFGLAEQQIVCLLYTSPSPRDS